VFLLAAACATTQEKPQGPIIDSFVIEGTHHLSSGDLEKRILTSTSMWSWLPWEQPPRFDPNAWIADQRRVERFYQAHGFYQARVVEEEVTPTKDDHVRLRLKVQEGEVTHVTAFEVRGLDGLTEKQRKSILGALPPKVGKPFLEDEWAQTQRTLADRLQELGYAAATLEAQATVDVKTLEAHLEIEATLGKRYRFGPVQVQNPDGHVPERMIRESVESAVTPGDWFTPDPLKEAQARLFQLGVFSAVKVTRGELDEEQGVAPIVADVREAPFHSKKFGAGLGADQLRDEARLTYEYQDRNFFGGLRKLTFRAKVGYALLASSQETGLLAFVSVARRDPGAQQGPFGLLHGEFEQPDVLVRWLSFQTSLELSHTIEPAYQATGGIAKVGLVARPTSHLGFAVSLNPSYYRLTRPPDLSTTTTNFYGCSLDCALVYLEQAAIWDHRDSVLEPKSGYYLGINLQEGGTNRLLPDGSSQYEVLNYLRVLPEARGYVSFFRDRFTLAARARLGILHSLTGADSAIPVRFFSGGNDMRGFSARRLAPFVAAPNDVCTKYLAADALPAGHCPGYGDQLPVGGNTLVDGSIELRWNAWESLTIATFVDAGYVSKAELSVEILRQLNVAVGIGVRYRTPIGPIRLDVAVRLPFGAPLEQYTVSGYPFAVNRGCFLGLGRGGSDVYPGSPEGQCAFHLSVGEAF
jgi:translocation and assembly module TamA